MAPRCRVIIDNDFAGDPDDLFQLAHHVLSPSVEIPFVIASKMPFGMGGGGVDSVAKGVGIARELLDLMGSVIPVLAGSESAIDSSLVPPLSQAAEALITEAMRDDTELPLYLAMGGGLTELAAALLNEPAIADRLTLIWIGGKGHPGTHHVPESNRPEFNTMVDYEAARIVFASRVPIWQVPQDAYSQCIVSWAELDARVRPLGNFGLLLVESLRSFQNLLEGESGMNLGETVILGDNPLVLLTALQSSFGADPASSRSEIRARPVFASDGTYDGENRDLPPIRLFTGIDTRLMLGDMFAKFETFARNQQLL